jgi:hypothetical protein
MAYIFQMKTKPTVQNKVGLWNEALGLEGLWRPELSQHP